MEKKVICSGSLSAAEQLFAGKYQSQQSQEMSPYQKQLFNSCLKGFQAYTTHEVACMSTSDRKTIMYRYGRTKQILNEMRQVMVTNTISTLFGKLFPAARGNSLSLLMQNITEPRMTTRVPLHVPKEALIRRLVAEHILPENIFNIAA